MSIFEYGGYLLEWSPSTVFVLRYVIEGIKKLPKYYGKNPELWMLTIPNFENIRQYMNLHWGLVALKQKQISMALSLALPAGFSPQAWQLFLEATASRKQPKENTNLRKKVLI